MKKKSYWLSISSVLVRLLLILIMDGLLFIANV